MITSLIAKGADPNRSNRNGETPLHVAAGLVVEPMASKSDLTDISGDEAHNRGETISAALTSLLIQNGAAVDALTSNGRHPLHLAATR